jgi:hypothetical protein
MKFGMLPTEDMILRRLNSIIPDADINQLEVTDITTPTPEDGTGVATISPKSNARLYVLTQSTTVTFDYYVERLDLALNIPSLVNIDYQQTITAMQVFSAVVNEYGSDTVNYPNLATIDPLGLIFGTPTPTGDGGTLQVQCDRDLG